MGRLRLMPMPLTTIANPSDIPAVIATDSTMDSTTTSTETGTETSTETGTATSTETSVTTTTTMATVSVIDGNFSKLHLVCNTVQIDYEIYEKILLMMLFELLQDK